MRIPILVLVLQIAAQSEQVANNRGDFTALCTIYNLAAKVAQGDAKGKTDESSEPADLIDEIRFLNMSAADQDFYDMGPQNNGTNPEEKKKATEEWRNNRQALQEKMSQRLGEKIARLPDSPARQLAARKISLILQKAQIPFDRFKQESKKATNALNEARTFAQKAIFGEGEVKWDGTITGATFLGKEGTDITAIKRGNANWGTTTTGKGCGLGGTENAGLNIISDLTCLCIGRGTTQHTNTANACAEGAQNFNEDFSATAATNLIAKATGWGKLKPFCEKILTVDKLPTSHRLNVALDNVLTRIGRVIAGALGGESTGNCGQVTGTKDLCVNYKTMIGSSDSAATNKGFRGITWVNDLYEAIKKLETAEEARNEAEAETEKIRSLATAALLAYQDGNHHSQLQANNPEKSTQTQSQKQNPTTSTDKTTSQDPTALNGGAIPRFILPWTLLI